MKRSMKTPQLPILILLIMSMSAFAVENQDVKKVEKTDVYGGVAKNETLDKLLAIDGVGAIYEQCKKDNPTGLDKIPNCIWTEVSKKPDLKKKVQETYAQAVKGDSKGRAPASGAPSENLTNRTVAVNTDYTSDPAVRTLTEFFGSKLEEVLHSEDTGKGNDRKITAIEHSKFIDLYKSQMGKSIVNAMTSYCLNTDINDSSTDCKDKGLCPYDEKKYKEDNIKNLKNADFSQAGNNNPWMKCIAAIPKICYEKGTPGDQTQACLVMDFVKSARKSLIHAEKQSEFYDKLGKEKSLSIASNFASPDQKKFNNDELMEITSADMEKKVKVMGADGKEKEQSVKEVNEALAKEAEACVDEATQKIKDEAKCKKFIDTNKDANEKALAEFGLAQEIQAERLAETLKDEKSVQDYLKEEGYTAEQASEMTKGKTLEDIKEEIRDRFKAEKEAIIKSMTAKIQKKTSAEDGKVTNSDSKLVTIKKEFATRTKDMGDLIKFTNVVSSYLGIIDDSTKKVSRNTASLFAEVKTMKDAEKEAYEQALKKANLTDQQNNTRLKIEDINGQILKYNNQPAAPAKKKP